MQSLQARIASFQKAKRVKRYPSKPTSSTASVKWPHPPDFKANANTLAEAGFFFSPSWDDRDSVTCFLCGKELSDWDESDDPFDIHYNKCQNSCGWAMVRCGLIEDLDSKGRFVFENKTRLPCSKAMEKARLQTFGHGWWPHDEEPGHGGASVKMARAGFVYTPQAAGDDTVTCLYCNLSLGGWETEDDPVQEHRQRRGNRAGAACPFITFSEPQSEDELAAVHITEAPPPPRAKRGKAARPTTSASSKPRRKTRATRGKSVKTSAPVSRRSPSPSQPVSCEQDPAPSLGVSTDVEASLASDPVSHSVTRSPPLSKDSKETQRDTGGDASAVRKSDSIHSLSVVPESPVGPGTLRKPSTSPDAAMNHPDLVVSLSSAGEPMVANPQLLTAREKAMSLEQWIRQEIDLSHERLLTDGQRQIELFQARAAELRKCIDEL